jgi:hypothetical protein
MTSPRAMIRRDPRMSLLVALTVAALLAVLATLISQVDRPYPGFFFSADYRVFPVSAASRAAGLGPGSPAEDLGVRQLKNVDEPMRLYRLR